MRRKRKTRLDLIVAILAVAIGVSTMVVYIVQARIMSKQMHATVWPYLEVVFSQGQAGLTVAVNNKGVGPAKIVRTRIIVDDKYFQERQLDSLLTQIIGFRPSWDYAAVQSRVMAPGERIALIEIAEQKSAMALDSAIRGHSIRLELCYCSVFDDCWVLSGSKTEPCDACKP